MIQHPVFSSTEEMLTFYGNLVNGSVEFYTNGATTTNMLPQDDSLLKYSRITALDIIDEAINMDVKFDDHGDVIHAELVLENTEEYTLLIDAVQRTTNVYTKNSSYAHKYYKDHYDLLETMTALAKMVQNYEKMAKRYEKYSSQ